MSASDVNGKPLVVGEWASIPCKIINIVQVGNYYRLDLEFKYKDNPEDIMIAVTGVNSKQVVKAE